MDGQDTYTPRTLIYDFKSGFGTLKHMNALYEDSESSTAGGIWYVRLDLIEFRLQCHS